MFTIFVYSDEFFDGGLRKTLFTAHEVAMIAVKAARGNGLVGEPF